LSLPPGIITIDSTGVGDAIAEQIARVRHIELFVFTQRSKQQLMESLAYAIQNRHITFPEIAAEELSNFEMVYSENGVKYSAPSGSHDDIVCAAAMCLKNFDVAATSGKISIW
jgi:hypothetical protein